MSYRIDLARRIVLTRGWGVLSALQLFDLMSHVVLDPRFDPAYRCLADLRDVTDITVDAMEAAQAAASPILAEGTRHAIVATSDVVFGVARMFASFSERAGRQVRVFREMTVAEAWLDG